MNVLELFAGTASFSNVAKKRGHTTFTTDYNPSFELDYTVDIKDFDPLVVPFYNDIELQKFI